MSKRLGSVGYKPNISHLYVGYNPLKKPLILNSWDIQIPPFFGDVWISSVVEMIFTKEWKTTGISKITAISSLSSHHISSISIGILDDWMTAWFNLTSMFWFDTYGPAIPQTSKSHNPELTTSDPYFLSGYQMIFRQYYISKLHLYTFITSIIKTQLCRWHCHNGNGNSTSLPWFFKTEAGRPRSRRVSA